MYLLNCTTFILAYKLIFPQISWIFIGILVTHSTVILLNAWVLSGNKGGDTLCFFEKEIWLLTGPIVLDIAFLVKIWNESGMKTEIRQKQYYCPNYFYVYKKNNSN